MHQSRSPLVVNWCILAVVTRSYALSLLRVQYLFALLAAAQLAVFLCSCSSAADDGSAGADSAVRHVAMNYLLAVSNGDYETASQYIVPEQRGMLKAVALSVPAGQRNRVVLSTDSIHVVRRGAGATATFIGSMCRAGTKTNSGAADCVRNSDPSSASPLFRVELVKVRSGVWQVEYITPSR